MPSNNKVGKMGDEHKRKKTWWNFNFLRGPSRRWANNVHTGEAIAKAIDIVAATRADRIWVAWSGSFSQTAPSSSSPTNDIQRIQWDIEDNPDEIWPVAIFDDGGLGQQQQQECNDEEIPERTLPASSTSEAGDDLGEQEVRTVE